MLEINYPIVIPAEPPAFQLMLTGIVTLLGYLTVTGKWRELCSRTSERRVVAGESFIIRSEGPAIAVYPICDYEIHFAYTFGNALSVVPPPKSAPHSLPAATAV